MNTGLGEAMIQSVNWSDFRVASGDAVRFGETLAQLLATRDSAETRSAWNKIENVVFSQDDIFSAAEPTIDVLLAALVDERSRHAKVAIIDLLFLLLHGDSLEDPGLRERCHERALKGLWLLAREASIESATMRDSILDIIELIDPGQAERLRIWLAS